MRGYACISMDQLPICPVNEVLQEDQVLLKQSPLTPAGVAEGGGRRTCPSDLQRNPTASYSQSETCQSNARPPAETTLSVLHVQMCRKSVSSVYEPAQTRSS